MASTEVAALAILALLQVSCALARHTDLPESCHGSKNHKCKGHGHGGSPAVSGRTPAIMTVNGFQKGEDGGGPAACDGRYHSDSEKVVALSTGWLRLDGKRRCHEMIRITSAHGRSVLAKVVDECDSARGCRDNIVDASRAVWKALGLDTNVGDVPVTWSDA